ncbi:hypothetical protein Y5S_02336 [Alcanivorax nanhaiticus]|uniref:Uncharacterized protein n=1 Tax=Alcanivorax nanhaiticus TaxID=1177154 RepID=A0A095SIY2_9GAMM|nr:hypothetical protein [Alcanivorax nanhaiticus]KGD64581.1 hypothetical protein Y5S_02336 [Alcanivorax nanhaiticus]
MEKRFFALRFEEIGPQGASLTSEDKKKDILENIVYQSILRSDAVYLYSGCSEGDEAQIQNAQEILRPLRGRYQVLPSLETFNCHYDFWRDKNCTRGALVWSHSFDASLMEELYSNSYDPYALNNPSALVSQNAVRNLRDKTKVKENEVGFILPDGVNGIFIFMSPHLLAKQYQKALGMCSYSEGFLNCYGRGSVNK